MLKIVCNSPRSLILRDVDLIWRIYHYELWRSWRILVRWLSGLKMKREILDFPFNLTRRLGSRARALFLWWKASWKNQRTKISPPIPLRKTRLLHSGRASSCYRTRTTLVPVIARKLAGKFSKRKRKEREREDYRYRYIML